MLRNLSRRALWMQKLAEEVARGLTAKIRSGEIAAAAALPDREAIAAEFVTSTGVVDRALELLTETGLVAVGEDGKPHAAPAQRPEHGFELPSDFGEAKADIVAILELRMGVELVSAALAAERRDDDDLDRIRATQAALKDATARGAGIAQADFQFHCAIARASANPYILELLDYLGPLLIPRMRVAPLLGRSDSDGPLDASRDEHEKIVAAIAARDGDAARVAMRAHLSRTIDMIRGMQ